MEKSTPNFMQDTLTNPYKSTENYPQKAKGMSFFAFVFSVFMYISIFHIFDLSPSKHLNNTKFWFFISNTLIIIILVDYGAFSSSSREKQHHDLYYQEYIMRRQRSSPSFNYITYDPPVPKTCINPEEEVKELQEKGKLAHQQRIKFHDNRLVAAPPESSQSRQPAYPTPQRKKKTEKRCTFHLENDNNKLESAPKHDDCNNESGDKKKVMTKTLQRSKSDIVKKVVIDESKNIVRRVESAGIYDSDITENEEEEKNDYANLSDEELNRRVEEFIQRFNRQIRLQRDVY